MCDGFEQGSAAGPAGLRRNVGIGETNVPTLLRAWQATLRTHGGRTAIVEAATGRRCTFAELDGRARAWAEAHGREGLLRRRAVVFAMPNSILWFENFLGLAYADAIAVPLDASEPESEQRRIAESIRAAFIWTGHGLATVPAARAFRNPAVQVVKVTSGTTGRPTALLFTAAQLLADAEHIVQTMAFDERDTNYALIPLGHSYGLGNLVLPLVIHAVPLVCGSAVLPHAIAADFVTHRPSVFPSVPTVWRALALADVRPDQLASLRLAISAGAPLPIDTARAFKTKFERHLHNFYGSSETGGIAFDRTGQATLSGAVGTAMGGVELSVAPGRRLRVTSDAVFTQGNRRRIGTRGQWVLPDIVAVEHDGSLRVLGRRGTMVKIGGRRIDIGDLAARLRGVPGVDDAWAAASNEEEPIIGAVLITKRALTEIKADVRNMLPAWKLPKKWATIVAWPMTARGKTDQRALRALLFS